MDAVEAAWRAQLIAAERDYRVSDALFRLHRDLFELETVTRKASRNQIRSVQLMVNGRWATAVAGAVVLVSFLSSITDLKWSSAPFIVIYFVIAFLLLLWLWQIRSAGEMEAGLKTLERDADFAELNDREEFVFEEVNANVVRHRVIDSIIAVLQSELVDGLSAKEQQRFREKLARYEDIQKACEGHVRALARASRLLVKNKKRDQETHDALMDWAAGIPGFSETEPSEPTDVGEADAGGTGQTKRDE